MICISQGDRYAIPFLSPILHISEFFYLSNRLIIVVWTAFICLLCLDMYGKKWPITFLRILVPVFKRMKLFLSSMFLISTYLAYSKIKTENGGQCAYFCAALHLIRPICPVNASCTYIIFLCFFFFLIMFYSNKSFDQL